MRGNEFADWADSLKKGDIVRIDHSGQLVRITNFGLARVGVIVKPIFGGKNFTEPVINLMAPSPLELLAAQAE